MRRCAKVNGGIEGRCKMRCDSCLFCELGKFLVGSFAVAGGIGYGTVLRRWRNVDPDKLL